MIFIQIERSFEETLVDLLRMVTIVGGFQANVFVKKLIKSILQVDVGTSERISVISVNH